MPILVLGQPLVRAGGATLRPVRRMARVLLGMFALRPNRPLTLEWIIDGLWPAKPPASAGANVRSHIAELRRLLGSAEPAIETFDDGYMLVTEPAGVDALRFQHLVSEGRRQAGSEAARVLAQAVGLWRGDVLEGVPIPSVVQSEAVVLDDLRMSAIEELVDIRMALGHQQDLVPMLKGLVVDHPLRERLWHQLLLALWATGRRSEVLDAYQRLSSLLDTELGVQPSAATTELHEMVRRRSED
jgi:DNA-binding SARP family transcriptional activator